MTRATELMKIQEAVNSAGAKLGNAERFGNEWLIAFYCDESITNQAMDIVACQLQDCQVCYHAIVQHDTKEKSAEDWPLFVQDYLEKARQAGVTFEP